MSAIGMAVAVALTLVAAAYLARRLLRGDRFTVNDTTPVESGVDHMSYRVQAHPGHGDARAAADMIARTNAGIIALLRRLKRRYGPAALVNGAASEPDLRRLYPGRAAATDALLARYSPDNLAENSPLDPEGDTSYVNDKGSLVAICLRERTKKGVSTMAMHDPDLIMFVAIHEMAHIAIDDRGHPPRFWSAFRWLLEEADAVPALRRAARARYDLHPVVYCGLRVAYNPFYDAALKPFD